MALASLTFGTMLERLQHTSSLSIEILQGPAGPNFGDMRFCPQIRTLHMQHMDLPYLETLVMEDCFQPKDTILKHASPITSILLNLLSNAEYTNI